MFAERGRRIGTYDVQCGVPAQDMVDSSGSYTAVPSQSSVDFVSKQRSDGLQYRVGIHHVRASLIAAVDQEQDLPPSMPRVEGYERPTRFKSRR